MEIKDFIPNYPSISDKRLQQKLLDKTEISRVDRTNKKTLDPQYFDFQVNIARIMSPFTPYNKALLNLDIGVGKCVHYLTQVLYSNGHSTNISSLWEDASYLDENWRQPTKDIYVESWDGKKFCNKKILKVYREPFPSRGMVKITTKRGKVLIKTLSHKVLVKVNEGTEWRSEVCVGDKLLHSSGQWDDVELVSMYDKRDHPFVYDLEIEDTHCYVADSYVTHNTCSGILMHEINKLYYGGGFRKTVFIGKGPSLLENWKTKYKELCPWIEKVYFDVDEDMDDEEIRRFINDTKKEWTKDEKDKFEASMKEQLNENFIFKTVVAFASQLSKMTDAQIEEFYSNRMFFLDEAQVLKNYKSPVYKQYERLFSIPKNIVVVFMTGTPITNLPWEGVSLINLLKPKEERLPVGPKFIERYYGKSGIKNEEELLKYYHGYVIHVRQTTDLPPRTFMTNPDVKMSNMKTPIYKLPMSDFQSEIYRKSLVEVQKTFRKKKTKAERGSINVPEYLWREVKDKKGNVVLDSEGKPRMEKVEHQSAAGGAFFRLALESSLFVYPDGSYGGKGYEKNVLKGKNLEFSPSLKSEFKKNLGKYSAIYKKIFDIIDENPQRVIYIYFDNLNNSGLRMFAKLLEELKGYSRTRGLKEYSKRKRYVVIDGSMKEKQIDSVLKTVAMSENADGSAVQIVLGSEVTQTGFTIRHATVGIVVNAQFTSTSTDQITQRINRPGSLDDVIALGMPIDTSIYLLAPYDTSSKEPSAYEQVYKIAEDKLVMNKPQLDLMNRAGLLCPVNYERNVHTEDENYECYSAKPSDEDGIWTYRRKRDDTKTDYLYFRDQEVEDIKDIIIEDIGNNGIVDIKDYLEEYPKMLVYRAGKLIASKRIIHENNSGEKSLIFNKGDLFFTDPSVSGDPNSSFYFTTSTFSTGKSLKDIMNEKAFNHDLEAVEELMSMDSPKAMRKLFFSLSKGTQNETFETSYLEKDENETLRIISGFKEVYDIDGDIYNIVWAEPPAQDTQYSAGTIPIEDPSKLRVLKEEGWAWVPPRETVKRDDGTEIIIEGYEDIIPKIKSLGKKKLVPKKFEGDFYATKSLKDGIFKIFLKGGRPGGRACANLSGKIYMEAYKKLGLFDKLYKKDIQDFKKKHKGKIKEQLSKVLKTTKLKAIPDDFTEDERIGAYFALMKKDTEKCEILEKEFRKQGLFYEIP